MQTMVIPLSEDVKNSPALQRLVEQRLLHEDEFIERHATGTLRRNKRLGFAWKAQYVEERIAFEFGWGFQCQPRSRVTFGDAITEGDCRQMTESGWIMERYLLRRPFPEDRFQVKYIKYDSHHQMYEGVGLILFETSAPFIPAGSVVFSIIAVYNPLKRDFEDELVPLH